MIYGFPCTCTPGEYEIIKDLEIDGLSCEKMDYTLSELKEERDGVPSLLAGR